MDTKKYVLIVTDGADSTVRIAEQIASELKKHDVVVRKVSDFAGTDILPADAFFLGCEQPNPPSFAYLSELLRHINLAGRPCGVFSPDSAKALTYLTGLVRDCEAVPGEPFMAKDGAAGLKQWVKSIL
ncbi:MAG: hypothetical protein LBG22_11735 [Treponema sp.]|nr:hypothetical protein [Treponema sp.]